MQQPGSFSWASDNPLLHSPTEFLLSLTEGQSMVSVWVCLPGLCFVPFVCLCTSLSGVYTVVFTEAGVMKHSLMMSVIRLLSDHGGNSPSLPSVKFRISSYLQGNLLKF